jgi:hypothetical protein
MSEDDLKESREAFEAASEHEADNRREAEDDLKFARDGIQWPEAIRRERELDGRPCLTINKLPPIIRQVVNDGRQNRPAIIVHPADSDADPETAEIFNGLIRNIEQSSDADVAYDTALDFAVSGGFGYFRINLAYSNDDSFEQDIVFERVANPFTIYGDPNSTAADSSDWNSAFAVDTMPKSAFERRWKGADPVDWEADGYGSLKSPWRDGDNVMVAEHWMREEVARAILALSNGQIMEQSAYEAQKPLFDSLGVTVIGRPREVKSHKVMQRIMTGAEVLDEIEWAGRYIPIVPVYGDDLIIDGKRKLRSLTRDAKDAQRMFNYWRSASTELVALAPKAPWVGPKGFAEADPEKWATANTASHSFIEYDGDVGPPQRQPFAGVPAGALQEALNASDDIKTITGIHDASLGARSNETSGRAIMARQREGDVSTFHYIDNLARAIRHAGRILIDLIPKTYATPRVVRILGPDLKPSVVKVNQPFDVEQKDPQTGQLQAISKIYDLTAGKYDLTVKAGPSFTSRREEAATQMIELIRAFPAAAPVVGDLFAENLDWPGADQIAERLRSMLPPNLRGEAAPSPEMEQAKQVIEQGAQAMQAMQAELDQLKQDRAMEARKLDIEAYNAETDRKKVDGENEAKKLSALGNLVRPVTA